MNQKQIDIMDKIDEMIGDVRHFVKKESERLLLSGGVDSGKHNYDSYLLPKIILAVALKNCVRQYEPVDPGNKREMYNLSNF